MESVTQMDVNSDNMAVFVITDVCFYPKNKNGPTINNKKKTCRRLLSAILFFKIYFRAFYAFMIVQSYIGKGGRQRGDDM